MKIILICIRLSLTVIEVCAGYKLFSVIIITQLLLTDFRFVPL